MVVELLVGGRAMRLGWVRGGRVRMLGWVRGGGVGR